MGAGGGREVLTLGRYALHGQIAAGGMATVYFGRLVGPVGFSRVVAVKRMHPHFACDPEFVAMFLDEAQLAARIQHPNVVSTLDVVAEGGEIFIVMEYLRGESLAALARASRRRGELVPLPIVASILVGALAGLHAAHEARDEHGELLDIVHRDVSPQNILVGQDGLARLMDFGVAKAASRLQVTRGDQLKGKVSYMAPEQLEAGAKTLDRSADIFSMGSVLWELLSGKRLFQGEDAGRTIAQVLACDVPALGAFRPDLPPKLEQVVKRALQRDPAHRFATAEDFGAALEAAAPSIASVRVVGEWVRQMAADVLAHREARVAEMESVSRPGTAGPPPFAIVLDPAADPLPRPSGPPGAGAGPSGWPAAPSPSMPPAVPPVVPNSQFPGSDASVGSVALPTTATGAPPRRRTGLAVALGGGAALAVLGVAIVIASRGGGAGAAAGHAGVTAESSAAPPAPASPPPPVAAEEPTSDPPAAPPELPTVAPAARPQGAPVGGVRPPGSAKKVEAPLPAATTKATARPPASSYLPERP